MEEMTADCDGLIGSRVYGEPIPGGVDVSARMDVGIAVAAMELAVETPDVS